MPTAGTLQPPMVVMIQYGNPARAPAGSPQVVPHPATTAVLVQGAAFNQRPEVLLELATRRMRIKRAKEWQEALNQKGKGSTFVRARIIAKEIYDKAAPVPDLTPSPDRNKFLHEVLARVEATCKEQNIGLE